MKTYRDFEVAYSEWREDGGAMSFVAKHLPGEEDVWQVGDTEEIEDVAIVSAREATEIALAEGGMSSQQIACDMADWG